MTVIRTGNEKLSVKTFYAVILPGLAISWLAGCTVTAISPEINALEIPDNWQKPAQSGRVQEDWLTDFADDELNVLVSRAMEKNYLLAEQMARIDEARQALIITSSDKYPELSLAFDASRRKSIIDETTESIAENYELGLDLFWEVDIWGKLDDAEKQSRLSLHALEARLQDTRLQLAADVASAWYDAIAARQLLSLFRDERLNNLVQELDIIDRGYQQGLNSALDVYLARVTLAQERARVAQQEQLLSEAVVSLQLLLQDYPDSRLPVADELPLIETAIPAGLPSELITRRPDLQQAWLELLAEDAGLAVAHKQRFPRLSLVAAAGDVSKDLENLLDGSALAWSLLGNLVQPLFNAGELRAAEEQARARVVQAEKRYLDQMFRAFAEVENAISRDVSLQQRYQATLAQEENATAALTLAFEQYQSGLVTYITVLESQRRAFDAEFSVIDLQNQLLQNRIVLHQALGGEYSL